MDPVKLVITNYPEGKTGDVEGKIIRNVKTKAGNVIYPSAGVVIEREDFKENPEKKFFRLGPGLKVRLNHAYISVTATIKTSMEKSRRFAANIFLKARADMIQADQCERHHTLGEYQEAIDVEVRVYDRLFRVENPAAEEGDFKEYMNPNSLQIISKTKAEPSLAATVAGDKFQFIRKGYFCADKEKQTRTTGFQSHGSVKR